MKVIEALMLKIEELQVRIGNPGNPISRYHWPRKMNERTSMIKDRYCGWSEAEHRAIFVE
jgi:hypothetical protein